MLINNTNINMHLLDICVPVSSLQVIQGPRYRCAKVAQAHTVPEYSRSGNNDGLVCYA